MKVRTMKKKDARILVERALLPFREISWAELVELIEAGPRVSEATDPQGHEYSIEIEAFWDGDKGGNVRVCAWISYSGWTAYFPLGDCFIKSPTGAFVGE